MTYHLYSNSNGWRIFHGHGKPGVVGTQKGRGMWSYFKTFMTSNKAPHPSFIQYTAFMYSFPDVEPVSCSKLSFNCCFSTCIQISQKAGKMVWYSHLCKISTVYCDPHSQRLLHGKIRQKEVYFWNSIAFSMIQWMMAIWSLVPLPFLNPAWTYGISQFMYCWSFAQRNYLGSMWDECNCVVVEHSLKSPFFGIAMKTTFAVLWPLLSFPNLLAYWVQ